MSVKIKKNKHKYFCGNQKKFHDKLKKKKKSGDLY